jgi:Uma2 family endonuclease
MSALDPSRPGEVVGTADSRVVMHGISWAGYEAQLALLGDASVPRVGYLDGAMELLKPSRDHERIRSALGRLVEAYALERNLELSPYGSWTLKAAPKAAGLEPDECYIVGADQRADIPDLAIEVAWTSGGIDKLEAYRRLGVREVWIWKDDALTVHVLEGDAYTVRDDSVVIEGLRPAWLLTFLDEPTALAAIRALRAQLA